MLTPQHKNRLRYSRAFMSFSVNDVKTAEEFYAQTLGLKTEMNSAGVLILLLAGGTDVVVYEKKNHVPAAFTLLNFPVEDVELAVYKLRAKGLSFIVNDAHFKTDALGIYRSQNSSDMAWFRDPSGNIMAVIEQQLI